MNQHEGEQEMGAEMKAVRSIEAKDFGGHWAEYEAWQRINALRRMRDVHRLAGFFTTRVYTDAEHCYYVGVLFEEMAALHSVKVTPQEVSWAYRHDALEVATGDLLYPAKNTSRETEEAWDTIEIEVGNKYPYLRMYAEKEARTFFTNDAWRLVKACDYLELWLCTREERARGNILTNLDGTTVEQTMYNVVSACQFKYIRMAVGVGH